MQHSFLIKLVLMSFLMFQTIHSFGSCNNIQINFVNNSGSTFWVYAKNYKNEWRRGSIPARGSLINFFTSDNSKGFWGSDKQNWVYVEVMSNQYHEKVYYANVIIKDLCGNLGEGAASQGSLFEQPGKKVVGAGPYYFLSDFNIKGNCACGKVWYRPDQACSCSPDSAGVWTLKMYDN